MALSLSSERSLAAASSANPLVAFARWIAQAKAARTRRTALMSLMELDQSRLDDLGISRRDIEDAMASPNQSARVLDNARARNAAI